MFVLGFCLFFIVLGFFSDFFDQSGWLISLFNGVSTSMGDQQFDLILLTKRKDFQLRATFIITVYRAAIL